MQALQGLVKAHMSGVVLARSGVDHTVQCWPGDVAVMFQRMSGEEFARVPLVEIDQGVFKYVYIRLYRCPGPGGIGLSVAGC